MANAVATKRGRGDRSSQAVVQARLAHAEQLIAQGTPRPEFIQSFHSRWPAIDVRTIDRYRTLAFRAIRDRREAERAHDIDARLQRLTYLSHKLEREQAYAPMMRAEQLLAQITGVMEPERHLHLHAQPQPAQAAPALNLRDAPEAVLAWLEEQAEAQGTPVIETRLLGPAGANGGGSEG